MKLVFRHHSETENLGDRVSGPYQYFPVLNNLGTPVDLAIPAPICDVIIYGGGKIMGGLAKTFSQSDFGAKIRIAWGVSTIQKNPVSIKYWRAFKNMNLIGSRDYLDNRFIYAPCASCMTEYFDKKYSEKNDIVFYAHAWKTNFLNIGIPPGIPVLTNSENSFEKVISFLGSASVVVSNSYHGVYWALLLGKRVICLPFSNKFDGYRLPPYFATASDWLSCINQAKAQPESLELCREATRAFYARVLKIINE